MIEFHSLIAFATLDSGQYVVLQLFVFQVVTSNILKLIVSF